MKCFSELCVFEHVQTAFSAHFWKEQEQFSSHDMVPLKYRLLCCFVLAVVNGFFLPCKQIKKKAVVISGLRVVCSGTMDQTVNSSVMSGFQQSAYTVDAQIYTDDEFIQRECLSRG